MKKNTIVSAFLIVFVFTVLYPVNTFADGRYKEKPWIKLFEKDEKSKKSGIFNLNLDIQLGATISKTTFNFNTTDTNNLTNTTSKVGPSAGLILSVDFLGYGFTTGLQYSSKGFKQDNGDKFNMNYFNIPLLLYFDFNIGKKVIIDGNIGPYFGLLLSSDDSPVYKIKNFDFGLTGNLQGAYMFSNNIGSLLGVKYEYGGLNNLGNNESIKSIRTSTMFIYTGVKFVL
jgi:hypothetical protein